MAGHLESHPGRTMLANLAHGKDSEYFGNAPLQTYGGQNCYPGTGYTNSKRLCCQWREASQLVLQETMDRLRYDTDDRHRLHSTVYHRRYSVRWR